MWTLYVAVDKRRPTRHDVGSVVCLDTLRHGVGVNVTTEVVTRADRPRWLRGTPTLHDAETNRAWCGYEAVAQLQAMALAHARTPPPPVKRADTAKPRAPTNPGPARPALQLRDRDRNDTREIEESAPEDSAESEELSARWASQIVDDDDAENVADERLGSGKLSGDDFSRAVQRTT